MGRGHPQVGEKVTAEAGLMTEEPGYLFLQTRRAEEIQRHLLAGQLSTAENLPADIPGGLLEVLEWLVLEVLPVEILPGIGQASWEPFHNLNTLHTGGVEIIVGRTAHRVKYEGGLTHPLGPPP
jgi:hypothetical protein